MKKTYTVLASAAVLIMGTMAVAGPGKKNNLIAGCDPDLFVSGAEQNVVELSDQEYSPRCLRVKAGASVTIQADQSHHLRPMDAIQGKQNIIGQQSDSYDTAQTRVLSEPGTYGYYCDEHGDASGQGMTGAIIVED